MRLFAEGAVGTVPGAEVLQVNSFDWLDQIINHQVAGAKGFQISRALAAAMLEVVKAAAEHNNKTPPTTDSGEDLELALVELLLMKPRS